MMHATYWGAEYQEMRGQPGLVRRHRSGLRSEGKEMLIQFDRGPMEFTHAWWDVHAHDLVLTRGPHEDATRRCEVRRAHLKKPWPYVDAGRWHSPWLKEVLTAARRPVIGFLGRRLEALRRTR